MTPTRLDPDSRAHSGETPEPLMTPYGVKRSLGRELEMAREEIAVLKKRLQENRDERARITAQNMDLRAKNAQLANEVTSLRADQSSPPAKVYDLEKVSAKLASAQERIEGLEEYVEELKDARDKACEDVGKLLRFLESLEELSDIDARHDTQYEVAGDIPF